LAEWNLCAYSTTSGTVKNILSSRAAVVYHRQWVAGASLSVVSQSVSFGPRFRPALNNVLGGSAASVLTVTFGLSYALLIFAGPLAQYLSYGVAATFISSAVLATVIALGSSVPFAVAGPESSTVAMTGILASSLVEIGRAHV